MLANLLCWRVCRLVRRHIPTPRSTYSRCRSIVTARFRHFRKSTGYGTGFMQRRQVTSRSLACRSPCLLTLDLIVLSIGTMQVAEKRKSLLDELAIKYQQETDQHREQVKAMTQQHADDCSRLRTEIGQLEVRWLAINVQTLCIPFIC